MSQHPRGTVGDFILNKTIKAMEFLNGKYTHFLRANLNVVIDPFRLKEYVETHRTNTIFTGPIFESNCPFGYAILYSADVANHLISEYKRLGGEHGFNFLERADDVTLMQLASGVRFLPYDSNIDYQSFNGLRNQQIMATTYKANNYLCSEYGLVIYDVNNIRKVFNIIKKAPKTTFLYRIYGNFNAKGYENKDSKLTLDDLQTIYEKLHSTIEQQKNP